MAEYLHILGRRQAENGSQALVVQLQLWNGHEDVAEERNITLRSANQGVYVSILSKDHVETPFVM